MQNAVFEEFKIEGINNPRVSQITPVVFAKALAESCVRVLSSSMV